MLRRRNGFGGDAAHRGKSETKTDPKEMELYFPVAY